MYTVFIEYIKKNYLKKNNNYKKKFFFEKINIKLKK
jgi:hypothetical protein